MLRPSPPEYPLQAGVTRVTAMPQAPGGGAPGVQEKSPELRRCCERLGWGPRRSGKVTRVTAMLQAPGGGAPAVQEKDVTRIEKHGFSRLSRVNTDVTGPLAEDDLILTYRATIRPLYRYVSRRVGGDHGLAEDLVQETWMRALDAWPARGVPDEPLAWLTRVARNVLVSHFRKARPEPVDPASIDVEDDRFSPEGPDTSAVIGWGLARLGRRHAEILE